MAKDKTVKIMVVDDSLFMRKILVDILKKAGYTDTIEAADGKAAVEKFKAKKPDLTLMDIIMPTSGIEALKGIMEADSHAKVMMVTAVGQESVIKEVRAIGAIDYITKPFKEDKVVAKVKLALS